MYDNGFATRFGMDIAFTALLMGPQRSHTRVRSLHLQSWQPCSAETLSMLALGCFMRSSVPAAGHNQSWDEWILLYLEQLLQTSQIQGNRDFLVNDKFATRPFRSFLVKQSNDERMGAITCSIIKKATTNQFLLELVTLSETTVSTVDEHEFDVWRSFWTCWLYSRRVQASRCQLHVDDPFRDRIKPESRILAFRWRLILHEWSHAQHHDSHSSS
jgi:hypothetical protein